MTFKIEQPSETKNDWLKWSMVAVLFIAGLVANYYYNSQPWPFRLLGWFFLAVVIGVIAFQTQKGKQALLFVRESRMELRKVFWPTRQETIQTTLIVAAMVALLAIILWFVDSGLMYAVGWLTGQRG